MDLNPKLQEWIKTEYPMMQNIEDAEELDVYDFNKFANWLCGQIEPLVIPKITEELQQVLDTLETFIGDTDPEDLDPDFTEDELRDEYPIIYCFQKLLKAKSNFSV